MVIRGNNGGDGWVIVPATVRLMDKGSACSVNKANCRILMVSIGEHEWDLYVPEDEFDAAMIKHVEKGESE
jgi:hypothetical protein